MASYNKYLYTQLMLKHLYYFYLLPVAGEADILEY